MKTFLVTVPLFDKNMAVAAYRMCDRSAENPLDTRKDFRGMREVLLSPGLDLVENIGLEPFSDGKPLFVDINHYQLLTGMPARLDLDISKMVGVLSHHTPQENETVYRCADLYDCGYRFAMEGFPEGGAENRFLPYLDYIILSCKDPLFSLRLKSMQRILPKQQVILCHVPDMDAFYTLSSRGEALFTGDFFTQPVTKGLPSISPIKINTLQLLRRVSEEDFELRDITKIIAHDPALTVSLLRFINSAAVGLSHRVDSIENAVAILGQLEVRRWATVAISVSLAEDRPSEVTRASMIRAKFAENLAPAFNLFDMRYSLFLTGLFSMLDIILQKPMAEAVAEVALNPTVQQALVEKTGPFCGLMELIFAYEHADWDRASILMIQNNTNIGVVSAAFLDALVWFNRLLISIRSEGQATVTHSEHPEKPHRPPTYIEKPVAPVPLQ